MDTALILMKQTFMMFLLCVVGYLMVKGKLISEQGSKSIGNMLIYLSLPAVILQSFLRDVSTDLVQALLLSGLAALVVLVLSMIVSTLLFKKDGIAAFAASFSNPGFFGIPLVIALLGNEAVIYIAFFVGFINLFQWTYGVMLMTGQKKGLTLKQIFSAPPLIGLFIGLFFLFSRCPRPALLCTFVSNIAAMNTPLAMIVTGGYLARVDLRKMFAKGKLYAISAVRLLLVPALSLVVLSVLPKQYEAVKIVLLIAAACPVGSNVAVYAQRHDRDAGYAAETVVISTLLSIVTIPALVVLATHFW